MLWELNFKDKLQEKCLEAGYFLPCKVVVYDLKGQVYMGMLSPTELIKSIKDDSLIEVAQSVEESLKKAMNNLG